MQTLEGVSSAGGSPHTSSSYVVNTVPATLGVHCQVVVSTVAALSLLGSLKSFDRIT